MQPYSRYSDIKNQNEIKNDFLKPIHKYAQKLCPKPEIIGNVLVQKIYAEILINFLPKDKIKFVSRMAIQQFEKISNSEYQIPDNCFSEMHAFRVNWFPDIDKDVVIKNSSSEDYPFYIPKNIVVNFKKMYPEPRVELQPVLVPFFVKKDSKAIRKEYGKISLSDVAYEMEF